MSENTPHLREIDSVVENLFHFAANLQSRLKKGEVFSNDEVHNISVRIQDYATDVQLAVSRCR
jgi:hypothetical protein